MPKIGTEKKVQTSVTMTPKSKRLWNKVCNVLGDVYFTYEIFDEMVTDYAKKKNIKLEK